MTDDELLARLLRRRNLGINECIHLGRALEAIGWAFSPPPNFRRTWLGAGSQHMHGLADSSLVMVLLNNTTQGVMVDFWVQESGSMVY